MLDELREEICEANRSLTDSGLVKLTWGNVSGIDRDKAIFGIKPSGIDYNALKPKDIVLVDLDGKVVDGNLNPSSDTKTHLELYKAWPEIGGITHTHSSSATSLAQLGKELPCYGTTHADHFYGTVPICRALNPQEVDEDYEKNTGLVIVEHFTGEEIDPVQIPGVLQLHHAPFTWGQNASKSLENSIALEVCASMALECWATDSSIKPIPQHILDKHFLRKHGSESYYGQGEN
ncbi:MAG: L-ribulose-5-phosphate 4-epimerase AraD [Verrucomicrobiales bacterium]|nr:L-ribulose-5-phosphate 4-epimerase AraD [Verrucomicrobiales bacterium]